ncbi:hypothetical protein E4T52_16435 [Aureobasidium sp. EXF-3400]|nr:hypothetical protein E4T51_15724 [Aureobasidium sp. EXF-12344]KAI4768477.1 hypothetical protein E4T52_16435 [Aureobasidium sp. EXF-3400]
MKSFVALLLVAFACASQALQPQQLENATAADILQLAAAELPVCAIGMGKDMWFVSFDHITEILEIFYFTELLYLAAIGLTKISMLLFYLRIFPDWKLRRAIYAMIGICGLYSVVFVTVTALQCIPVSMAWKKWDGEHHGKCLDLNADGWASASLNIILDLIVIALPMKQLTSLNMSWQRKLGVIVMFLGGGFVTIVSILRLKYLIQFAHTDNVTWDYLPVGYWSAVETHVGVMVACAPAIRSLQFQIREKLWPKPTTQSSYYSSDTKNSSKARSKVDSANRSWGGGVVSKTDGPRSRLSSLGSPHRKDDFVQIDEYEMNVGDEFGRGRRRDEEDRLGVEDVESERSVTRSYTPNDDAAPLAATAAPIGRGYVNGILVQTDWSVGRESRERGRAT